MNVIDVSKHQLNFYPDVAATQGVDAVIIRLAYGASVDKTATDWAWSIHREGLPLGGYGFATWHCKSVNKGSVACARTAMYKQVDVWVAAAKATGVNWWVAIDQELEKDEEMALSMDDNTAILAEAAERIKAAGLVPCLYCSVAWDYDHIRTNSLPEYLPYWFAYYPDSIRAEDFGKAKMDALPVGKYARWFRKVYDAGRLCGWQYGSTGHGHQYGCASENVDRDVFFFGPAQDQHYTVDLHRVTTGAMSPGDLEAVLAVLWDRDIPYEVT